MNNGEVLERAKGLEPSTPTLARSCSCKALAGVRSAMYDPDEGLS